MQFGTTEFREFMIESYMDCIVSDSIADLYRTTNYLIQVLNNHAKVIEVLAQKLNNERVKTKRAEDLLKRRGKTDEDKIKGLRETVASRKQEIGIGIHEALAEGSAQVVSIKKKNLVDQKP